MDDPRIPAFLSDADELREVERGIFVGREGELAQLDEFLEKALIGQGQVCFVSGGAGSGKTVFMDEFARRALDQHTDLLLGVGNCNAFSGVGDPYLPFREILGMLTGDVELRWSEGTITREHAQRMWASTPLAINSLLEHGPLLIDTFVPGKDLISRALAASPTGTDLPQRLAETIDLTANEQRALEENRLIDQYANLFRSMASKQPLLLVLDDIHWADTASVNLLFHLARRLEGSRILILCAYSPDELAEDQPSTLSRQSRLTKVLRKLKLYFGGVSIDIGEFDETNGRDLVDAILSIEPNHLEEPFRKALFQRTRGHPLFTVELLRELQESGGIAHDEQGFWVEGSILDWDGLPAHLEGVIEERVGRVEPESRELLDLASVEGQHFTVQLLAQAKGQDEAVITKILRDELDRRHRLVVEAGYEYVNGRRIDRYRFQHFLLQRFLFSRLNATDRRSLHAQVGPRLEELYEGQTYRITVELARHWLGAGEDEKAAEYLLEAGDQARALDAAEVAEQHYGQAVEILREGKQHELATEIMMKMGLKHTEAFDQAAEPDVFEQALASWEDIREIVDDPAGKVIRGYALRERIGIGGFGAVYRAEQPSVDREVAIKIILPEYANHPEFIRRFEAEARTVARLEHPHIVPLYDYWRDEEGACLVMRWLRGGSLREVLEDGPLEVKATGRLLEQIAAALKASHDQGVVHRDLKPENILLDEEGNAYLTDFGIAKDLGGEGLTKEGMIVGSADYVAPEHARGEPVTPKIDIYALGVVLYELLTGTHPFPGLTQVQVMQRHLNEPLPLMRASRPELPESLDTMIQIATAKNPAERYSNALDLVEAYQQALDSEGVPPSQPDEPWVPAFMSDADGIREVDRGIFVGREGELAQLDEYLEKALLGQGQVCFVSGGAGSGKTVLMDEFTRRVLDQHTDLLLGVGNCYAFSGVGDPYLPFREILGMLTGDVELRWSEGTITREHAVRLWEAVPDTDQALVEYGPNLIDVFVACKGLLTRAKTAVGGEPGWLGRLRKLCEREHKPHGNLEQRNLFEQYEAVLGAVAHNHPLVLTLDDLQWADAASVNLLFHLGRRLAGKRIMILGAFRPEEVALGRGAEQHPLKKVLAEFRRQYGDILVDLSVTPEAERRQFVGAILDSEPNQLSDDFRQAMYDRTGGHPLFTVELVRELRERGDLTKDNNGRWVEEPDLDWRVLPPRVEGVIEERIGRLEQELRETLTVASVEGERFTAQVVARVQQLDERKLLGRLSRELEKRHQLVRARGESSVGEQLLSRYQFTHSLFHQFLYSDLSEGERRLLHGDVARVLEELYGGETEAIAVQLAHHYSRAGQVDQAIQYLQLAGDQARILYAHDEAIEHYQRALRLLKEQGGNEQAAQTLMKLGLVYTADFKPEEARKAYEEAFAIWEPLRESRDFPDIGTPAAVMHLAVAEPITLDPGMIGDDVSAFIIAQLFEGLVEISPDYNVLPAMAARWEVSEGGRQYIFRLQEGLLWSDGTPLTAADFEYAWKRNLALASHSPVSHLLSVIENARAFRDGEIDDLDSLGVVALDDLTLQVWQDRPTAFFPHLLAHPVTYPLPSSIVEQQGQDWPAPGSLVSNGAYQLVEWEPGERLVLGKNPLYQGHFPGNAETIECPIIIDFETVFQAYDSDALDVISMIKADPGTVTRARVAYPSELHFTPQPSTFYLTFLADRQPFSDARVRRAFVSAVDREALVRDVSKGQFLPARGGFIPLGMPGHSDAIGLAHDPEKGRQELAEAGYPEGDGFPEVTVLYSGGSRNDQVVSFLQRSWREHLSLHVEAQSVTWGDFIDRRDHDPPHLSLGGWSADYPDPDSMLRLFHSTEGVNPPRWHNESYDALVEEAARATSQLERMDLYLKAERILVVEDAAIMPLGYAQGRNMVKPWVTMPQVSPMLLRLKNIVIGRRVDSSEGTSGEVKGIERGE